MATTGRPTPTASTVSGAPRPADGKLPRLEKKRGPYHLLSPFLRFLQFAAAVCAFSAVISSTKDGNGLNGLKYSEFMGLTYLVAGTVIAAAWALFMLMLDVFLLCLGITIHMRALPIFYLVMDFVASSFALSAGAAGAGITTFSDRGAYPYAQAFCQGDTPWNFFCSRAKAGVAMALICFFFFLPSIALDIIYISLETDNSGS